MMQEERDDHNASDGVEPVWPDAPRYAPDVPLPAMAYVPGARRHERADVTVLVQGHSDGLRDDFYRFGIDLYHCGFHWEAHEAFEVLWQPLPRRCVEAAFFRGLILNAAAQLKRREGRPRGIGKLSWKSYERLMEVLPHTCMGAFLKMDVAHLLQEMERHYGALWEQQNGGGALCGLAPRLQLNVQ